MPMITGFSATNNSMRVNEGLVTAGSIKPWGANSTPDGWLLCSGQSVLVATYPNLFATIGYSYGGSGVNFTLPDLRNRTIVHKDDNLAGSYSNRLTVGGSGVVGSTFGAVGGVETVILTNTQLPNHTHTVYDPAHIHGNTFNDATHYHGAWNSVGGTASHGTQLNFAKIGGVGEGDELFADNLTDPRYTNASITNVIAYTGISVPYNPGGSNPTGNALHSNTQPTIVMNCIIKV